jgi:hypothetical protein
MEYGVIMTAVYLYRVLGTDSDGDPLDFGVIRAKDISQALHFVRGRLVDVFGEDEAEATVRLYPLADVKGGCLPDLSHYTDHIVTGTFSMP